MIKKIFKLKILDTYILKKYVYTFLFTMMLMSLVAVVFEVSERIEKFISNIHYKQYFTMDVSHEVAFDCETKYCL